MTTFADLNTLQFVVKLSIWLGGAWMLQFALRRCNPRWRVGLWRTTTLGIVILSFALLTSPWYKLPWLPHSEGHTVGAKEPSTSFQPADSNLGPATSSQREMVKRSPSQFDSLPESMTRKVAASSRSVDVNGDIPEPQRLSRATSVLTDNSRTDRGLVWAVSWPTVLVASYGVIAGWLVLKVAFGLVLSWQAVSLSIPTEGWVRALADELMREYRIPVERVRTTLHFKSPVLCGVFRPVVLLPESMLQGASARRDVKAALAHEGAHAAGRDLPWDMVIALVSAVFWPNPLVWKIRVVHREACEQVSDRVAADILGDDSAYQSVLAGLALRVAASPGEVGLAMARRSEIRSRLESLIRLPRATRLGRRGFAIGACILCTFSLIGFGTLVARPEAVIAAEEPASKPTVSAPVITKTEQPAAASARSRPQSLKFKILREGDNQPVADAKISMKMYGKPKNVNLEITTDAKGEATFDYPDGQEPVDLWAMVHHSGLVPYYVGFGRGLVPAALPTSKTIYMKRGKKISGKIVDPDHEPVGGAQLSILVPATDTPSEIHYRLLDVKTGEDGRWSLDGAPLNVAGLSLRAEHPRFIPALTPVQDREDGEYLLDPGLTLTGRVVNNQGQPVPKLSITIGQDRWGSNEPQTDIKSDGSYVVYALKPQSTWVTAEAPGYAPQIKPAVVDRENKPVDFQLLPGKTTRFRVVDPDGKPVAGMSIVADTWKGFRSLQWDAKTDAQGLASWDGAPDEVVKYDIVGAGYAAQRDVMVRPQAEPHVITIRKPLKVEGRVLDSKEQKVPEFRVSLGRKFYGRQTREIHWYSHEGTTGRNGTFEIDYDEFCEEIYLRVEANGFEPWVSEAIPFRKGSESLLIHLKAGDGPSGVVLAPDGKPAAGARLCLLTEQEGMQFTGSYNVSGGKQKVVADEQGRFGFLALTEPGLIAAVHDSGYAEVTAADVIQNKEIRLQAWARIEAVVRYRGQPLPDVKFTVMPEHRRNQPVQIFSYGISGKTDATGHITFNQIIPGKMYLARVVEQQTGRGHTNYMERSKTLDLKPAQVIQLDLGGAGATVKGRLAVAGTPPATHVWRQNEALTIVTPRGTGSPEEQQYYRCLIDDDGAFQIADIPPGRYELRVYLTAAPDPNVCGTGARIGTIRKEIEIAPDQPEVDLGVISGEWDKRLGPGEQAPLFVAEGLGGDKVVLGALRGKLVLLDFWSTTCLPCMAEMPELKELHQKFAQDSRFDMVGLSLDETLDAAKVVVERQQLPWKMALAGPGTHAVIPSRYDVQTIPEKFLIDVDGKILYRGRDLKVIADAIAKRLQELPDPVGEVAAGISGVVPMKIEDDFHSSQPIAVVLAFENINYEGRGKPTLEGPGLKMWSADGKEIRAVNNVGTSAWLTGPQRLALDVERERIYVCDTHNDRLMAFDRHGHQSFATDIPNLHAAAVDERTGDIWCLALGNLASGELLILDPTGREKDRLPMTAYGLAFSPVDDAFFIVGKSIAKVNRTGKIVSSHSIPDGGYTFTDVAVDRQRGGAWVLEDNHPDKPKSAFRLWKVQPDGKATTTHTFPTTSLPRTLTCVQAQPWLAVMGNYKFRDDNRNPTWDVQRFDSNGAPLNALPLPALDITVGPKTGTIWVRTKDNIQQIDEHGKTLLTILCPSEPHSVQLSAF